MTDTQLTGTKVLILVSNGVDEAVMSAVQRDLLKTGAVIKTIGTESGLVNSWNNDNWGLYFPVDQQIGQVLGSDFDCLIVPSGSRSVLKLSNNPHSERIISSFLTADKPMVFMGDAIELLAKLDLAKGLKVSGPESVHQVMTAAGATWEAAEQCVSGPLMTGACTDVSAFIQGVIAHFSAQPEMKAAA
ncbi:MAG: peptidase C56 [Alphaproteobacteria bacterium]|nr:peptidase C56 [Alphaproteobacteria bacterium]